MLERKLAQNFLEVRRKRQQCSQGRSKLFSQKDDVLTALLSSAEGCMNLLETLLCQIQESSLMVWQSVTLLWRGKAREFLVRYLYLSSPASRCVSFRSGDAKCLVGNLWICGVGVSESGNSPCVEVLH